MTTISMKSADVQRKWYIIDAEGKILGRLATEITKHLRGKHKVEYTPHIDIGDYIIIINAEKIYVNRKKLQQKHYQHHTGYIGNLKSISLHQQLKKAPEYIIKHAVRGMLPRNSLGTSIFKKLRVYTGPNHSHQAQRPQILDF